jgi:hypothetical protein
MNIVLMEKGYCNLLPTLYAISEDILFFAICADGLQE